MTTRIHEDDLKIAVNNCLSGCTSKRIVFTVFLLGGDRWRIIHGEPDTILAPGCCVLRAIVHQKQTKKETCSAAIKEIKYVGQDIIHIVSSEYND